MSILSCLKGFKGHRKDRYVRMICCDFSNPRVQVILNSMFSEFLKGKKLRIGTK